MSEHARDAPSRGVALRLGAIPLKGAPLTLVPLAALVVAGCGGSVGTSRNGDKKGKSGPTIRQVVQVSRNNPGLRKCKKVSYGLLDNTPESPAEPDVILSITCDGRTVGSYYRYKTAAARDADEGIEDRPYLINGAIKVTTGEAILAHINADAWKTMPAELKAACGCGEVRTPK
jgi:hypothetical protein